MKLQKISQVEPELNHDGDRVTATVTHNIKVNGEDAWVKYEISHEVKPGEELSQVDDRLLNHASITVVRLAETSAKKVIEYQASLEN